MIILLLILAAPFTYNASVAKREKTSVDVRARWFYGIIGVKYRYKNNTADNQLYFLNWKIHNADRREGHKTVHKPDEKKRKPEEPGTKIKKTYVKKTPERPETKSNPLAELIHYPAKKELLEKTLLLSKRLFKIIKPKYFNLSGEIGFESPHHTGYLLAALGIARGLKGINIDVTPNMEDSVFDFDLNARGYVTLLGLCIPFAAYALSRPVRRAIGKYIKNK